MLLLRLKEIVGSKVYYYYQKEGKGEWGLYAMIKRQGTEFA